MSEHENDGFYWEPAAEDALRQGDLLLNVPSGLMPDRPRFVLGDGEEVETVTFDDYPDAAPSTDIVVDARFAALSMIVTPTCHVSEGEKDEDIVAIVPVEPLAPQVTLERARDIARGKNVPFHFFYLPPTELGGSVLPFRAVALLDRPSSLLKHNLAAYRRLGLYVSARVELRGQLAAFWGRVNARDRIEQTVQHQREAGRELEDLE